MRIGDYESDQMKKESERLNPNCCSVQFISPSKAEIIKTIHALLHESLFGSRPWLAGYDTVCGLIEQLNRLGLQEPVPGKLNTWRATPLGNELNIDLMEVFMGLWAPSEVPFILKQNDLVSEDEAFEVYRRVIEGEEHGMAEDLELILLPLVRHAFFRYFQGNTRKN